MKKTKLSVVKVLTIPALLFFVFVSISAQNTQEETPKPTPEAKPSSRERRAGEVKKSSTPTNVPAEDYSLPQPQDLPPTVDYMKEAEKFQKKMEANSRRQTADAQRQIEQMQQESQAESDRQQEIQNQILQQQNDRLDQSVVQQRLDALESKRQEEAQKKIEAEQWKWIWLIPLFELLQTVGLALIAYKFNVARKSIIAMTAGLSICLLLYLVVVTKLKIDLFPFGLVVGIISIYAYAVGKLSAYVIVSLLPEKLPVKLLTVFGIGCSLIALYSLIDAKAGHGSIGTIFGLGVIIIGGVIAVARGTRGGKEDLHGSARFAGKKDFKEFETAVETGAFILAPAHPDGRHGKIALPRSLSVMHGLIFGGSGTGKTRGYFMANCAEVENTSIVVTDPKSELGLAGAFVRNVTVSVFRQSDHPQ